MEELNLCYTDQEFIDEVLKRTGKKKEDFIEPLFEDNTFMNLALCFLWESTNEVLERISDKLWDDKNFCVTAYFYICDDLDYYISKIPEKHFDDPLFISTLVSHNTKILEYIPKKYLNNSLIFAEAILNMDVSDEYDWRCNEFMYIVDKITENVWNDESFVFDLVSYTWDINFDYRFEEFLDCLPTKYFNDKDFIMHVYENSSSTCYDLIYDRISDNLREDNIFITSLMENYY